MKILTRAFLVAAATFLTSGQALQAAPCQVLATFFSDVVRATSAEIEPDRFKAQITNIRTHGKACSVIVAQMADEGIYSHATAGVILPLEEYLRDDARFAVQVIGEVKEVKAIQFDKDVVAVLHRRPTR